MNPTPLSIAWVIYDSLEIVSGGTIYDRRIVEGLRGLGHAVEIIALTRSDRPSEVREKANHALARLAQAPGATPVFVCDELCFPHLPHLPKGPRRVLLVHHLSLWEHEARGPISRLREIACVRAFDTCIATGPKTSARLREEFGIDAALVPPGADRLLRFRREARGSGVLHDTGLLEKRPPRLLFVGSVTPRKRVFELLETLARAGHPTHVTLVGSLERDVAYVAEVMARVKRLATETPALSLVFEGEVTDEALAKHYETHDALVVASSLEGYGMVVDEALSFGTPVLIERDAVATDTLVPGSNARVFSFSDPSPLFSYIANESERRDLAMACREASTRLPTWAASVEAFAAALAT